MPSVLLGSSLLLHSLSFVLRTAAFSFAISPPTQCDPFTISWTGGKPPYDILITPAFDSPRKFLIPEFPENGSFVVQLPLNAGNQFVVSMSDATGFATGGISDLHTVGKSIRGESCSTATPSLSFFFDLPSPLNQCKPYDVKWDLAAVLPVNITGLIPLGKPVQLSSGADNGSFVWDQVNVPSGTRIIFFLTDSQGRFGGSSKVLTVGDSDDNSCINEQSPQSTASLKSGSPSSTGSPQATVTVSPSHGVSAAAIGGAVAGGLVACLIIGTLAAFFFRTYLPNRRASSRYSRGRSYYGGSSMPPHSSNPLSQFAPDGNNPGSGTPSNWTTFDSSEPQGLSNQYAVEPFTPVLQRQQYQLSHNIPSSPSTVTRNGRTSSKSSMDYPPNRPARFILHTDAEEEIELPPQYNDRLTRQQRQSGSQTSDNQIS